RAQNFETAGSSLSSILSTFYPPAVKPAPGVPPVPTRSLTLNVVALAVAMGQEDKLPEAKDQKQLVQAGTAVGKAWRNDPAAQGLTDKLPRDLKLEALIGIADAASDDALARSAVESALGLLASDFKQTKVPGWHLVRLMQIGRRVGIE